MVDTDLAMTTDALIFMKDFFAPKMADKVMGTFSKAFQIISDVPVFKTDKAIKDEQVATAVSNVQSAVKHTFVHARSYVVKCYALAQFVCDEKEYTIQAINDGNADEFKDYLEEVLDKSKCCQNDINTLMEFIDRKQKPIIKEEELKVIQTREAASNQAVNGLLVALGGGSLALLGAGSLASLSAVGIGGVALLEAVVAGIGIVSTTVGVAGAGAAAGAGFFALGAALCNPVGAAVVGFVGLAAAIAGVAICLKGGILHRDSKQLIAYCERSLDAIRELTAVLDEINSELNKVNEQLKTAIDNNLKDLVADEEKFKKLAKKKPTVQRSLVGKIEEVVFECGHLKEYCGPLRDAASLEIFVERCTKTKTK